MTVSSNSFGGSASPPTASSSDTPGGSASPPTASSSETPGGSASPPTASSSETPGGSASPPTASSSRNTTVAEDGNPPMHNPAPTPSRSSASRPMRRYPAHHRPHERWNQRVMLYVTACTKDRIALLANEAMHAMLRNAWAEADAWAVGYYLIMPEHVHFFCTPAQTPMYNIKRWCAYWKRQVSLLCNSSASALVVTLGGSASPPTASPSKNTAVAEDGNPPCADAKQMRHSVRSIWQTNIWDTQMRSFDHYLDKREYVRQNPVRRGLVARPEDWLYQGNMSEIQW